METVFTEYREELLLIEHRKPDILVIDHVLRKCTTVEVTVCYDLYFDYAFREKLGVERVFAVYYEDMGGTLN